MSIEDIFKRHGEADFRAGEVKVIARLLKDESVVLGTGGGAFINPDTRTLVKASALSVWIKADFELLFQRVSRRSNRPLLKTANPRETLQKLIEQRYPIYAEADVTVVSRDVPQDQVATEVIDALLAHFEQRGANGGRTWLSRSRYMCRSASAPMTYSSATTCSRAPESG